MSEIDEPIIITQPRRKCSYFIEPAVFLTVFAWSLSGPVLTNQMIHQSCSAVYDYNKTVCDALVEKHETNDTKLIEAQIQPYVAKILLVKALVEISVSTVLCLQWGPWSDTFGRKPIIIANFVGSLLFFGVVVSLSALSNNININPWFYLLASIPLIATGGIPTLISIIFSYVYDTCLPEERSFRTGITQVAILLGTLVGSLASGELLRFEIVDSTVIFTISTISILVATLYIWICIQETINVSSENISGIHTIFQFHRFRGIYDIAFNNRSVHDGWTTWLCLLVFGLMAFSTSGASTVFYLFVREQFNWDILQFNFYTATSTIVIGLGGVIALFFFNKIFDISDALLGMVGFVSAAIEACTIAVAVFTWQMYLSIFVGLVKNVSYITCRTILTNNVSDLDIGKMNALMTSVEAVFGLVGAFIYTLVYNQTITWYPGAYNFISLVINLVNGIFLIIIYKWKKSATQYGNINNEDDDDKTT